MSINNIIMQKGNSQIVDEITNEITMHTFRSVVCGYRPKI